MKNCFTEINKWKLEFKKQKDLPVEEHSGRSAVNQLV